MARAGTIRGRGPEGRGRTPTIAGFFRGRANLGLGLFLIGAVVLAALVSFIWLPFDPNDMDFAARLAPPSAEHLLGTDQFGRDLLSRLMVGARSTLYVGVIAVGIALGLGGLIGAVSGYLGGLVDELLMRVADVLYAFPPILLAILLAAIYRPGTLTAMVAIGVATVPVFARLMRSSVLTLKGRDFVEAGRALGASNRRLLWRHIIPSAVSPILVQASLSLAIAILAEAALSFLGLGTPPRVPSWGNMLREAQSFMALSSYPALVPGLAIVMTVLGWSLLGDGLRDALDPQSRR
jgi:peptide/nickel transport system permease protein